MNYKAQSQKLASYFNHIASDFDSYYEKPKNIFDRITNNLLRKPVISKRLQIALKVLSPKPKKQILDIGCGSGVLAIPLSQIGHNVTGIDFSEKMISIAKTQTRIAKTTIDYQVGDFMKVDNKKTDACVALGVLEYFKKPQSFIEKMLSLVPHHGIIVFDLPSVFNVHTPLRLPYLLFRKQKAYFYSKSGIRKLLRPFDEVLSSKSFFPYGAGWVVVLKKK